MADLRFEKDGIKIPSINIAPVSKLINVTQKYDNIGLIRPTSNHMGTFDIIEDSTITTMQSALDKLNTLWDFDDYNSVNHILTWGNSTISSPTSNSCYFKYNDNSYDYYSSTNHNNNTESSTFFIKTDRCIILVGTYYCIFVGYATNIETNEQVKCSGHISTDGSLNHHFYLDNGESISIDSFPSNSSVSDNSDFFYYGSIISSSHYIIDKLANATILGRRNVTGEYLIGTTPLYLVSRFAVIDSVLSTEEISDYINADVLDKLAMTPESLEECAIEELKINSDNIRPMFYYNYYNSSNYRTIFNITPIKMLTANNCNWVGHNAFYNNKNLEQVNLGANTNSSVIIINDNAFNNCSNLHTVNIPNDSNLSLGSYAFNNCTKLSNINLNHLTYANSYCMTNTNITEINSSGVVRLNSGSFLNCSNLTSVNFPNVTYAESSVFENCSNLANINMPKLVTAGSYLFKGTSVVELNLPNLSNLSSSMCNNVTTLVTINIPNVSGSVGSSCFTNCISLETLSIPNVNGVSNYAFENCTKLLELDVPLATYLGSYAFVNCTSLVTVNCPSISSHTLVDNIFLNCSNLTTFNTKDNYINRVNANCFRNCRSFANFDFTNIDTIQQYAFSNTGFTSITIPKISGTNIGEGAFMGCPNLTSVNIPNITTLAYNCFRNCPNLTTIDLPKLTTVNNNAFRGCASLNNITLPKVATLSTGTFEDCTGLTSYDFTGTSTTNIRSWCFANSGLTDIVVPGNISMQDSVFFNCVNLANATLGGHTTLGGNTFYGCVNLANLTLGRTGNITGCVNNALTLTQISAGNGLIIVPDNLVSTYKSNNGWSRYVDQIIGTSDVPNTRIVKNPNLLENVEFIIGNLGTNGIFVDSNSFACTSDYMFLEAGTYHLYFKDFEGVPMKAQFYLYDYDGSNYTFNKYTTYTTSPSDVVLEQDSYIKILCGPTSSYQKITDIDYVWTRYMSKDYTSPYDIIIDTP